MNTARNEKRNRMNPSSITLNKAGISAMPLQLQRWTPSLIVPKEWIGCPKSWWEREAQPNESIIDHTKQSWYFSNASSALTLDAELNRSKGVDWLSQILVGTRSATE
ncbi:Hypothetical_protein [Hexamita inflata]|uniref:Hypothetical_protein n=1 Tax=Hexamita inflata TaxID=28002 RepID=A0AA86QRM5_9EUKA|nr:Hypothetical protein HINF_LOCUS45609 [Hexamita inflata]